jgi:ABC-2 type transport system ATP-binding protein/lipopolysaccharide transport system ATP-binding protein
MCAPIVVVDEVLAVGDAEFQQKCLGKIERLSAAGRTVVFVSHDLGAIRQLCQRTIWLDEGRVRGDGRTAELIQEYVSSIGTRATSIDFEPQGVQPVELLGVAVTDRDGAPLDAPRRDHPFAVHVRFAARSRMPDVNVAIYLLDHRGVHVLDESFSDADGWRGTVSEPGEYEATLAVPPVLAAGNYVIGVWIGLSIGSADETFVHREVLNLQLWPAPHDRQDDRARVVRISPEWQVVRRDTDSWPIPS